ncbi:MAG: hypothetical protein E7006_02860 [Alphaproteobacteria bacterium]|nr:hypothetical protein [Alphaproteobacteria bacterium]
MLKPSNMHEYNKQIEYHSEMAKTMLYLTCICGATGVAALLATIGICLERNPDLHTTSMITSATGGALIAAAIKTATLYKKEKELAQKLREQSKQSQK